MKLHHIGLNIASPTEVEHFYTNILKCWPDKRFELSQPLAKQIFGQDQPAQVFTVRNASMVFELFLGPSGYTPVFQHLCVEVCDRDHIAEKAHAYGYPVIRIERDDYDLLFIKDKAGNTFELKSPAGENQS
jgi:catechol 2,3-dioxygenase-like lactoylglutathione lyase family enzyme